MASFSNNASFNHISGMLQMLMDTDLDANQRDYAKTAHDSGKDLISLINGVLDQAKIESCRLELETVPFDLRSVLDNVLSLFSSKSNEKGIEVNTKMTFLSSSVLVDFTNYINFVNVVVLAEGSWPFTSPIKCLKLLLVTLDGSGR